MKKWVCWGVGLILMWGCSSHSHGVVDQFMDSLDGAQKQSALKNFEGNERTHWHYIPKEKRHGLRVADMNDAQYQNMLKVIMMVMSDQGVMKTKAVMEMEQILREFEGEWRDPKEYFFTQYGQAGKGKWGFSFEGHHISLNFTFDGEQLISCTPMFFGANPARILDNKTSQLKKGDEPLALEEKLAFALVNSLNDEQKKKALNSKILRADMREGHKVKPGQYDPFGISFKDLNATQQQQLIDLIVRAYVGNVHSKYKAALIEKITNQKESLKFAFYGEPQSDKNHHYRIEGENLVILLFNTQRGTKRTPANHIHVVWRDRQNDFGLK